MNSLVGPDEDGYQPPPWCENSIVAWLQESKSSRDGVKKKSIRSIVIPHHWLIRTETLEIFTCNLWYRFSSSIHYSSSIHHGCHAVRAEASGAENWCLSGIGGRPTWHMTKGQVAVGRPWLVQSTKPPKKWGAKLLWEAEGGKILFSPSNFYPQDTSHTNIGCIRCDINLN